MKIRSYKFLNEKLLRVWDEYGRHLDIRLTSNSGRIIATPKLWDEHRGNFIGEEVQSGTRVVIHHHIKFDGPQLTSIDKFSNEKWYFKNFTCSNSQLESIRIALDDVIEGKKYFLGINDCHVGTNKSCFNKTHSDGVWRFLTFVGALWLGYKGYKSISS